MISTSVRLLSSVVVGSVLLVSCTGDSGGDRANGASPHADAIANLTALVPAGARGVMAVDVAGLVGGGSSADAATLLEPGNTAPVLGELLGAFPDLTGAVDVPEQVTSALLVQPADPAAGVALVAAVQGDSIDAITGGDSLTSAGTVGSGSHRLYEDGGGNQLTLLAEDGVLVIGTKAAVESVVAVADGEGSDSDAPDGGKAITPFLGALDGDKDLSYAYGLPALFDEEIVADRSLRGAAVVSGAFDVVDDSIEGSIAFHTSNASEFVEAYNALNRNAVGAEDATEEPLALAKPLVKGLGQVVVPLPPTPIDGSPQDSAATRNIIKKVFVGMDAHNYAEGVADAGNEALVDLIVKSEQDDDTPPSPGSVFIRWEFRDQAAIDAFEANELPEGFTLAPTQFLESDNAEGEYFLTLNLYNAGGGSIVSGARAEWDVFVQPPAAADPDGGQRPRFMIIDALAEDVSADPINLVTEPEPLSHRFVDDTVVSTVRRTEGDQAVPVFESSFPTPDPETAEVARFTREMAISNDYIYWGNGVYDRAVYNATTFNYDAYLVDQTKISVNDVSHWASYLKPAVKDAVYYVNTLEYVASPMANLDSEYLEVTPEWREELIAFKTNGHQAGLMRGAVDQMFRGQSDALVASRVANTTPSTYVTFEITDPEAFAQAVELPDGQELAPIALVDGGPEGHYLTLSVSTAEGAIEGTRAEWSVYVDDGSGRPHQQMVDLMTAEAGVDAASIVTSPSAVRHHMEDGTVRIELASPDVTFDAAFATEGATDERLTLDWVESGDNVCDPSGMCDKRYYDAETLDVAVHRPADVTVDTFAAPWDDFVAATPALVFYRDNAQDYAIKRWHNLKVAVDELPVQGLDDRTHVISGSGALDGRTTDVVDSTYTYTGDAVVTDDELTFSIDQEVVNALGTSHIFTTGTFDLATGTGTQTVVDCRGPDLMCGDIASGSTALFTAQDLDVSDPDAITWRSDAVIDLGGTFGTADSASTFLATRE